MGGKVWSREEERVYWRVILPQSPKRIDTSLAQVKSWDELAELMQFIMSTDAKRTYTHLGLFEHYFQNVEKDRVSPNAAGYVREYQQAVKRALKAKAMKEAKKKAEFEGCQSDDAITILNESQKNDSQSGNGSAYGINETVEVENQFENESEEDSAANEKENQPVTCFPAQRNQTRLPALFPYSPALAAGVGPYDEYAPGMSIQTPLSPEHLTLEVEDAHQPHDRAHAANISPYNEYFPYKVAQASLPAERSTLEDAPSGAFKRRNSHRVHPYKDLRLQRHGRPSTKDHGRGQSQTQSTTYYEAPLMNFGYQVPPMELHHYGHPTEHFQPYLAEYQHYPRLVGHSMGFHDRAHDHCHAYPMSYAPQHAMSHGFYDGQDWELPNRISASMSANYGSSESRASSTDYHGRNPFIPERVQRPSSSASGGEQPGQWAAALDGEFEPFETPARCQN